MSIPYQIISTGSQGNAVIINRSILIDCGVPYKYIAPYLKDLKLVLLTHIHGDHFNKTTIARMAKERPTLRFGCCSWLAKPLVEIGVKKANIDVYQTSVMYGYGICNVIPVMLYHDVPNCGYKLHFPIGKVIYATDTRSMYGITAKGYDLYLVEANYEDSELQARIDAKVSAGEFVYENRVKKWHLSKAQCDDFLYSNMSAKSEYVYMHQHLDKKPTGSVESGEF